MRRLAQFVVRRRVAILVGAAVFVPVAAALGAPVAGSLSSGGFDNPGAESTRASEDAERLFGAGQPNVLLLVTATRGVVNDPDVVDAGEELTRRLEAEPGIREVASYWTLGFPPPLRSDDMRQALVLGRFAGSEDELRVAAERVAHAYPRSDDTISVAVGGAGEMFREITEQAESDLQKAEAIALPLTLLLLVVVFGSVVAATLPLGVGVVAVLGTMVLLRAVASVTQVSIFALNLTTAMGLGLAIDYSLFIVSRFREELRAQARAAGGDATVRQEHVAPALLRTMHTAGRTVAFSAVTVALSLAALLVFPLAFLRSFAYAGIGVVAMAGVGSLVVLPALLAVLGPRIDRGVLIRLRERPAEESFWYRRARAVMRRPVPVAVAVVAVLAVLGLPFLRLEAGLSDDRVLPQSSPGRQVHEDLRRNFTSGEASAMPVVAAGLGDVAARAPDIDAYAKRLSAIQGVARVDAPTGFYAAGDLLAGPSPLTSRFVRDHDAWLSVVPSVEPFSAEGEQLVHALRAVPSPFDVVVGGPSAELVDTKQALFSRLPIALALIAVTTFVLLFAMVGSLLVPAKALALNVLSLSATFGALVWVFQDGNLSRVLGFTATGSISVYMPILLFCIAFGLSMDYEVFLLSRIKEEYDSSQDNEAAVAMGMHRTGRIVTAAALLMAMVFVALATAQVKEVKLFGIGLALAVLVDAFLIRATLVPAFMKIAGRANWWAPRSLRRLHLRFGIWETEPLRVLDLTAADGSITHRDDVATRRKSGA